MGGPPAGPRAAHRLRRAPPLFLAFRRAVDRELGLHGARIDYVTRPTRRLDRPDRPSRPVAAPCRSIPRGRRPRWSRDHRAGSRRGWIMAPAWPARGPGGDDACGIPRAGPRPGKQFPTGFQTRRQPMNRTFRAAHAGRGQPVRASQPPPRRVAQQSANERVYRQEALAHARAVTTAWRRLESYILEGSAGTPDPDGISLSGWERAGPACRQRLACGLDATRRAGALLRRHAAGLSRARAPQGRRPRSPRGPGSAPCLRRQRSARRGPGAALAGSRPGHGCRGPPFGAAPRLPVRYRSSAGLFRRAAPRSPARCAIPTPTRTNA